MALGVTDKMDKLQVVILVLAFVACMFFTGKVIYHAAYVINNVIGKHSSFFGPFILFMPSQFNKIGNKHRVSLFPSLLGVAASWLIFFLYGVLDV